MARLFVALRIPDATRQTLSTLLPGGVPSLRKTPCERLHLTLRFIGNADESVVSDALSEVCISDQLALHIQGTNLFGSIQNPKVLWAGIEASEALQQLHGDIESKLSTAGFAPDTRAWTPHITLARIGRSQALRQSQKSLRGRAIERFLEEGGELDLPASSAKGFSLYASETQAGLLHYREVRRFELLAQ